MAIFNLTANTTYYASLWGFDGTRWNGTAMVAPSTITDANWGTGMVTLVELVNSSSSKTGVYTFAAPEGLPEGSYLLSIHSVATFEVAENAVAQMEFTWDGEAEDADSKAVVDAAIADAELATADKQPDIKPVVDSAGNTSSKLANVAHGGIAATITLETAIVADASKLGGKTVTVSENGTTFPAVVPTKEAIASQVETQVISETDGNLVLKAITDKIASVNPSLSGLTLAAIASQIRTELAVELARMDAAISTRLAAAGYTAPPSAEAIADAVLDEAKGTHTGLLAGVALDSTVQKAAAAVTLPTLPSVTVGGYAEGQTPAKIGDKMDLIDAPNSTALTAVAAAVWTSSAAMLARFATLVASIWASATRTLMGSASVVGPDAATSVAPIYATAQRSGTLGLYARVRNWNGDDLLPAAVASIAYSITHHDDAVDGHTDESLTPADVLLSAVQSDAWASNYNFRFIPDITTDDAFADEGEYIVSVRFTLTTGQPIVATFIVKVA